MKDLSNIHEKIAKDAFGDKYVTVYGHRCGKSKKVDGGESLKNGWGKCCGLTMSLDNTLKIKE